MTGLAGTPWPGALEYRRAIGSSKNYLSGALRDFQPVLHGRMPVVATGARAVVVKGHFRGQTVGLRLFTVDPKGAASRYNALESHLSRHSCPPLVPVTWEDVAISIGGRDYPGLLMDWLDGQVLDHYLVKGGALGNAEIVTALAVSWEQLADQLATAKVAHGDLQHGNIVITRAGDIRLVDLDSVWVPGSKAAAPERGLPAYQHPYRSQSDWGPHVDAFSLLLIAASLWALAERPALWRHNSQTNLIFTESALADPHDPIWDELSNLAEPVRTYAECLRQWIQREPGWLKIADVVRLFGEPSAPNVQQIQPASAKANGGPRFDFWADGPSSLFSARGGRR